MASDTGTPISQACPLEHESAHKHVEQNPLLTVARLDAMATATPATHWSCR